MIEPLVLYTERRDVVLRQFATELDDHAYFEAVNENREHLSKYGDLTSDNYQTIEDVQHRRLNAGSDIRMGIWTADEVFRGGITGRVSDNMSEAEVGYWLNASAQGHGYATLAVRAMTKYLRPTYPRVFAEVHINNQPSLNVLARSGYEQTGEAIRKWGPVIILEPK